jgi:NADH-quinone oxidoreductase subunit B
LQKKISAQSLTGAGRPRHLHADEPSEFVVPQYGAHDLVPPNNPKLWQIALNKTKTDGCVADKDEPGQD